MLNVGDLIPLHRFRDREAAEWERGHLHDLGITALVVVRDRTAPLDTLLEDGDYELVVPLVDAARAASALDRERTPPPAPDDEGSSEAISSAYEI